MKFEDSIGISNTRWRLIKGFMILIAQYLIIKVMTDSLNVKTEMPKTFGSFESAMRAFQELISEDADND